MVDVLLLVEGGGDTDAQHREFRRGFRIFLEKAGLKGQMPRIAACGARRHAYEDFYGALSQRKAAMLLVDSEEPVTAPSAWAHLERRADDRWPRPAGATDDDCHLMVQCMESWFLADRSAVAEYFGKHYNSKALPAAHVSVEGIPKDAAVRALENASAKCGKGRYSKGRHSFVLLERIDPAKVAAASAWAARLIATLRARLGA